MVTKELKGRFSSDLIVADEVTKFLGQIHLGRVVVHRADDNVGLKSEPIEQRDEKVAHLDAVARLRGQRRGRRVDLVTHRSLREVGDKVRDEFRARPDVKEMRVRKNRRL